jgi:multiple sugar transport system substrate-binding protein
MAAAQTLTRDVDGDGRLDQYGAGVEPELIRVAPFIWQNMGVVSYDTALALTSPKALTAVQWFVDWQTKYHIVPTAAEEQAETSESRFINGRTAMYFNSRRVVPTFRTITAFDWDVAPLPKGVTDATILHSDAYCLPAASRRKEAAWAFIAFANSGEGQTLIAQTGRTVPSLVQVAESSAFLTPGQKPEHSQVFIDVIPRILALPLQTNWADIEEVADAELQRAFYGEASVPEAMQAAVDRTTLMFIETE